MGFVNVTDDPLGNWYTIDQERGLILRKTYGPDRDEGYEFELDIQGKKVIFSGTSGMKYPQNSELSKTIGKAVWDLNWQFNRLSIPKNLPHSTEDVKKLVSDALVIWGYNYDQAGADKVTVSFSS